MTMFLSNNERRNHAASKQTRPIRVRKRQHNRDYRSPSTTTTTKTKRKKPRKTVKMLRDDYFYEKYSTCRHKALLQPIPESNSEHDGIISATSSIPYNRSISLTTIAPPEDSYDAATSYATATLVVDCTPYPQIV